MSISILNHDRVQALGLDVNGGKWSSFPRECWDVTFAGAVLDEYERNGYDDSDFYAVVWDEDKQCVRSIEYASTRGWTYANGVTVDATDEVRAKAIAWSHKQALAAEESFQRARYAKPYVGATVTVARGRKVPQGFTGTVLSIERLPAFRGNYMEDWALVTNGSASHKVKAEYCDVAPNPDEVERRIADHLSECQHRLSRWEPNGRSMLWAGIRQNTRP